MFEQLDHPNPWSPSADDLAPHNRPSAPHSPPPHRDARWERRRDVARRCTRRILARQWWQRALEPCPNTRQLHHDHGHEDDHDNDHDSRPDRSAQPLGHDSERDQWCRHYRRCTRSAFYFDIRLCATS
jgi:hypothetical protein